MSTELIVAMIGLAVSLTVWGVFVFRGGRAKETREPGQVRHIRIRGSYQPAEVHVSAGQPSRLIFRREETAPCSERVVFPDYGISVTLPAFEDVAVDLPASEPGAHEFTCQMEMLHGRLIVNEAPLSGHARREALTQ